MKKAVALMAMLMMVLGAGQALAADYQPGVNYKVLDQPVRTDDPSKVEVVEVFGYWCPHCNHFEPKLYQWRQTLNKKAYFKGLPVVFRKNETDLAKAYYVAKILGVLDRTHEAMFDYLHKQFQPVENKAQLAKFFMAHGVSQADFDKAYGSFSLNGMMAAGKKKVREYQITGVPSIVVNGKYLVTKSMASTGKQLDEDGQEQEFLNVVDFLINKEIKENGL